MFERVLIANRGEIARRIMRTCRRLAIGTVAVYSDADADAPHVREADRAVHIGGAPPAESYLRGERLVAAARSTGARAIHPGYGFLSENAAFARAVESAGLAFVGPTADTIERMGSKAEAKRAMAEAGVPTVPGYHGEAQDDALLAREAERIGFPLMIKATAGGGGKGMRVVRTAADFAAALGAARREAAGAFGEDRVLLERYLDEPRHIEVQIFGDGAGGVVHLFERDCSSQRRYQKIIEEAPAPRLDGRLRTAICEAAVRAAAAVAYRNAGTVEFILDRTGEFYFMEMNTRLQVEHPVTEAITGIDLVEWQLRVASGEPLPAAQEAIRPRGHALEARLYAEDPEKGFLPSTGRIDWLACPPGVRVDTGIEEGSTVTVHYDPMIAKLTVHGPDRPAALAALGRALEHTVLRGPRSNRDFLLALARHERFVTGRMHTAWLDGEGGDALRAGPRGPPPVRALTAAALLCLGSEERTARERQARRPDPHSPWASADGWRPGHAGRRVISLRWRDEHHAVDAWGHGGAYRLALPDGDTVTVLASGHDRRTLAWRTEAGVDSLIALAHGAWLHVVAAGRVWEFTAEPAFAPPAGEDAGEDQVRAPMPGRVVALSVGPGDAVTRGQALGVLEAMKMELALTAPRTGAIAAVHAAEGEFVEGDQLLITLDERGEDARGSAEDEDGT